MAPEVPTAPLEGTRHLTEREEQVLERLVAGESNKEISAALGITPKTVMHHTSSIYRKLDVRGRAQAVARQLRQTSRPAR
nr:LuxR C-terminal-related transcriptional regulator [Ornithinimicrobium sediminis]